MYSYRMTYNVLGVYIYIYRYISLCIYYLLCVYIYIYIYMHIQTNWHALAPRSSDCSSLVCGPVRREASVVIVLVVV